MKLGTTDISIMNVRNITGCPSTDLGTLCVASSDGNGYAFKIVENGHTTGNGYIFADDLGFPTKYPYWNVFSNNSPAEWVAAQYPAKILSFRIKRDSSNKYMFSLGSFGGYDSDSEAPQVPNETISFKQGVTVNNYPANLKIRSMGSYDWTKLGAKYGQLILYTDDTLSTPYYTSDKFSLTDGSTIKIATIYLTLSTTTASSTTYTAAIMLLDIADGEIGLLPALGAVTVSVVAGTTVRIYANITGKNGVSARLIGSAVTNQFSQSVVSNVAKVTAVAKQATNYAIKSVNITCKDANGNEVYNADRDPVDSDFPVHFSDVNEIATGSNITMTASVPTAAWNSISSTGCSMTINLYLS